MRAPAITAVLRQLVAIWPDSPPVLIGANALPDIGPRHTDDLDFVVAMEQDDIARRLTTRAGWSVDPKLPFRWRSPEGQRIDILPAGARALAAGKIEWPGGFEMSLVGFDLALAHWTDEPIGEGASIRVATPPVIALLKMVAYLDRPAERQRDLGDLAHLMDSYVSPVDDRRFDEAAGHTFDAAPAYLLGLDLGRVCLPAHLAVVAAFLALLENRDGAHHALMQRQGPSGGREGDVLADRLRAFRSGLASE